MTKAAGDSVTITVPGKKTMIPQTGHTDISYAIEHFYADIAQDELLTGCKIASVDINLPATGMGTIAFAFMGANAQAGTVQYFTSPARTRPAASARRSMARSRSAARSTR